MRQISVNMAQCDMLPPRNYIQCGLGWTKHNFSSVYPKAKRRSPKVFLHHCSNQIAICDYETNECHFGPVWYAAAKKLYSMCAWKSKAELSPPFTRSCVLNDSLGTFWARPWIDEVKMASFVKYCLKAVNPKLAQWQSRTEPKIFTIGKAKHTKKTTFGQPMLNSH